MSTDMHIIAVGARTPVGLRAESAAAAVRAGIVRVKRHPFFVDGDSEPLNLAFDARLEPELPAWQRIAALAGSAIAEVLAKAASAALAPEGLQVLLSLPETRPGFSEADVQRVAHSLSQGAARGLGLEVIGRGHAGALEALKVASERAARGKEEYFVVCGTDSYMDADALDWLEERGRVKRSNVRSGFTPGESSGALLMAAEGTLRGRGARQSLAVIRGVATSMETRTILSDADSQGEGLTRAIRAATSGLKLPEEAVDAVFCDINGERYRTEEWGCALLRSQGTAKTTDYQLSTDSWGDVGAASAALECVLAVQSWRRGYAAGPRALVCAGSDGGLRGAAVLEQRAQKDAGAW